MDVRAKLKPKMLVIINIAGRSDARRPDVAQGTGIRSMPIYGRNASGMMIDPSAC